DGSNLLELAAGAECPLAREDDRLRAGVQHVSRGAYISATRHDGGWTPDIRRMALDLLGRLFVLADFLLLKIDRNGDMRNAALGKRRAAARIDERTDVTGAKNHLIVDSDVFEKREQVDFLLVVGADEIVIGLAGNRENR